MEIESNTIRNSNNIEYVDLPLLAKKIKTKSEAIFFAQCNSKNFSKIKIYTYLKRHVLM